MAEIIDLCEYRKNKEENEITRLREELASLIEEMGGVHSIPMYIMDMETDITTVDRTTDLSPTFYTQPWTSWTWPLNDTNDDSTKE